MIRKLARNMAKANMHKKGLTGICKRKGHRSFFAQHWREYVKMV